MEVDNKNVDSANDSVESFEDAIDSLEITEESKPDKTEVKPEKTEVKPENTEVKPEKMEVKPEKIDTTKSTESKPSPGSSSVSVDDTTEKTEVKPKKTEVNPEKMEVTEELKVLLSDTNTSKENNDTTKSTESKPSPDSISVSVDKTVSLESKTTEVESESSVIEVKTSELDVKTTELEVKTSNGVVKPTEAPNVVLSSENLLHVNSKQLEEQKDPKSSTAAVNSSISNANSEEKPSPNNVESITTMLPDLVINEVNVDQKLSVSELKEKSICEVTDEKIEGIQNENISKVSNVEITKTVLENNVTKVSDKEMVKDPEVIPKEPSPKPSKEDTKENITPIDLIPKEEIKAVELTHSEKPMELQEKDTTDSSLLQEENDSTNKNKSDTSLDDNKDENSVLKEDGEINDNDDEEGSIKSEERECGDGQGEQDDKKELDHDEDKRNPEYIPKKGSFYEHDTRTMDGFDDDVKKIEEETAARSKKKPKPVSAENRWTHDKFDELEQGPKSQQEIIDTYGYDIRNEEHAPKARRNRRYGRGPNKYNRNWEDEKAYLKVEKQPRPPGTRGPRQNSDRSGRLSGSDNHNHQQEREEFPPLARGEHQGEKRSAIPIPAANVDNKVPADNDKAGGFQYMDKIGMKAEKGAWVPPPPFSQKNVVNKYNKNHANKNSNESDKSHISLPTNVSQKDSPPQSNDKTSPPKPKGFVPVNNANFALTNSPRNNFRPAVPNNGQQQQMRGEAFPNGNKGARSRLPESGLIRPRANWEPNNWYINQKVENTGPPESPDLSNKDYSKLPGAGAVSLRGGKRYSVQRQQSLPDPGRNPNSYGKDSPVPSTDGEVESPTAQQGVPQTVPQGGQTLTAYYHHPTTGTAPPITVPQSSPSHLVFTQSPPPPTPAAPIIKGDYVNLNIAGETPIYHSNSFQPAPVYTTEPTHPISNGGATAPPMLLPVHFVSPPPNQVPPFNGNQAPIMNYAPQPMQYQPMQPIVSLPPPPQTEVFQPAGGITYYSPQTQAVLQRPALSKRVKSAIPIVPPNEMSNLMQHSLALQNNMLQQKQQVLQHHPVQVVPLEINKDESMSN